MRFHFRPSVSGHHTQFHAFEPSILACVQVFFVPRHLAHEVDFVPLTFVESKAEACYTLSNPISRWSGQGHWFWTSASSDGADIYTCLVQCRVAVVVVFVQSIDIHPADEENGISPAGDFLHDKTLCSSSMCENDTIVVHSVPYQYRTPSRIYTVNQQQQSKLHTRRIE